jgi:hypothetical protein
MAHGCRVIAFDPTKVRLQLSVLAYNLGNLWRLLALPKKINHWSLTSLQQRLVKGGRLVTGGRKEGGTARSLKNRLHCHTFSFFRTGKRPAPGPSESLWMEKLHEAGTGEGVWV